MKIVLFTDTFQPELNGVATSVTTLFNLLKENGHEVYVVTTNSETKKIIYKDNILRIPGIRLKQIYDYTLAPLYDRTAMRILKKINPDIIHIHTDFSIAMLGYQYKEHVNAPVVYTYHTMYEDYTYYITKGKIDRLSKWIIRQYSLAVSEKNDEIIAPSHKSLNYLRRIGYNGYVNIVPTGIDTTRFINYKLDENKKREFLASQNIPEGSKIVLFLGRLAKEKNVEELLANFKDLSSLREDTYFVIAGDGPNRPKLEAYAEELGIMDKVRFLGYVPYSEIDFYYNIADVFVNASVSETQGLTYLEAMACRRLILAKYDSNLTELINEGTNGYFFETKEEFLKKICKILEISDTSYSVMAKNMLDTVQHLSLESFYVNIMEVYERAKRKNI